MSEGGAEEPTFKVVTGPSREWIERMLELDEDMTYTAMAQRWFRESGESVDPRVIYKRAKWLGIAPERRARNDWELPWRIAGEHRNHKLYLLLNYTAQMNNGTGPIPRHQTTLRYRLRRFLGDTAEPVSIAYKSTSPDGFYVVQREAGDRKVAVPAEWGEEWAGLPEVWIAPRDQADLDD